MTKYKLLSTFHIINYLPNKIELEYFDLTNLRGFRLLLKLIKLLNKINKHDIFLVSNAGSLIMLTCFFYKVISRHRTMIVFWDTLLYRPIGMKSKILTMIKVILLKSVDWFYCNHRDTSGYEKYYKIPKNKFYYIPFKANNYYMLSEIEVGDKGYVLACGASHRDYQTFIKAINVLEYPTKILLPEKGIAAYHGSELSEKNISENLEIIRHNFDSRSWNKYLANAKIVVIPIKKGTLQSAGISVYLESMALGKPVVITEGVSTKGVLTNDVAVIVPAENSEQLALAIKKLWEDDEYRNRISSNGKNYALSLGGAKRLVEDMLTALCYHFSI